MAGGAHTKDRLMTVGEWADRLGVGRSTAYRYVNAGMVTRTRLGAPGKRAKTRISEAAHQEFLKRNTEAGPSRGRAA